MSQPTKRSPGAPRGNKNGVGNKGNTNPKPRADTVTLNVTVSAKVYADLVRMNEEGFGPKSKIIQSVLSTYLGYYENQVREMAVALRELEQKRKAVQAEIDARADKLG